ncbi:hypothetical protein CO174_04360 [Candidatus Uhrbacteria bacterium CG_4_9_14_3_um_filter_50_9]|uniref:50S ribosomal protein L7/L12 n=1 Tax=Candidatus Uhrbacteria bacterium CG_4_9_14_3_um_filter_50_9 TaxID=1975035 RepID=A0A2M7XBF8_9BACT|nr:MAG: hypothetical protein CO174_04360 [Candidatus Uhrbacteria bacterium CG_4_9_14_3_um_filter_50_9]
MNDLDPTFEYEPDVESHATEVEHGDARTRLAMQMLHQVRDSLNHVIQLLEEGDTARATRRMVDFVSQKKSVAGELEDLTGSRVLEGVFDGQFMVGSDGVRYNVPENYASKSKLVEGDILKLTIKPDGTYLFKQIGPVDRKRLVGRLGVDSSTNEHVVISGDAVYKVLAASISYFKGATGDEVVVLVPTSDGCVWAAVENIVRGN